MEFAKTRCGGQSTHRDAMAAVFGREEPFEAGRLFVKSIGWVRVGGWSMGRLGQTQSMQGHGGIGSQGKGTLRKTSASSSVACRRLPVIANFASLGAWRLAIGDAWCVPSFTDTTHSTTDPNPINILPQKAKHTGAGQANVVDEATLPPQVSRINN